MHLHVHTHAHTPARAHSGQAGEALPGQKEAGPPPSGPANSRWDEQGPAHQEALGLEAWRPVCVQVSLLGKRPGDPMREKVPQALVTQGEEPPVGMAPAATPEGQPAAPRGCTWPSLTPMSRPPSRAAGADKLLSGHDLIQPLQPHLGEVPPRRTRHLPGVQAGTQGRRLRAPVCFLATAPQGSPRAVPSRLT